ncbi:hypothetical protein ABMA10_05090 [Plantibacter sp. RU18]
MTDRHTGSRSVSSRRLAIGSVLAGAVGIAALCLSAPAAHAASTLYANDARINSGDVLDSGTRPSVSGGSVNVSVSVGQQSITNYYDRPGYTVLSENVTAAGTQAFTSRSPASPNAKSKCSWWVSVGGYADITCSVSD